MMRQPSRPEAVPSVEMRVDVSVIVVNWNTRDLLLKCLGSVSDGIRKYSFEVIVVDNHSSDGSSEAVREHFPHVVVLENDRNLGFAKANNIGIERSRGRYVCLVNSDVVVLQGCVDILVELADTDSRAGIIGPRIVNLDGTLQKTWWGFPSVGNTILRVLWLDMLMLKLRPKAWEDGPSIEQSVDSVSGCFMLIRRATLQETGLLDEGFFFYGEDVDLCRRCWDNNWKVMYCNAAASIHAGGSSSAVAPVKYYIELQKANLRYWIKHHGARGGTFHLVSILLYHCVRLLPLVVVFLFKAASRSNTRTKIVRSVESVKWVFSLSRRAHA